MPAKKGRTCFVPLCKGGYKSAAEKVSLFRAPVDPLRRQEWARNIKREDKVLDETCVVCSRHFDERYIEKTFKHVINGELVELDRERPVLTDDAVPTIFPNAPSYLTRPVPKKRKERNLADRGTPPVKRRAASGSTHDSDPGNACTEPAPETHPFSDILPPSMYCSRIILSNDPTALCFGWHARMESDDLRVIKHVTFSACVEATAAQGSAYLCAIYCRGIKVEEICVSRRDDALGALKKAEQLRLCPGCEIEPVAAGSPFSCSGRKKRLEKAQESVAKLRAVTETISSSVLEEKIRSLPPKQRLAVRTCFEAASRKSSRGMAYDMQWVLECILMRMRSPQLYEYVRRHKIIALPSKSCLDKHMQGFKSTFGFNTSVFSALEKKTRDMDEFSRHGGLVYDEIKLSENINVTASGELSGFVDLGPFMEDSNETALSDHGLVIVFQPFKGKLTQILGVFASRGNVKAPVLSKILLEATILAENSGLFVDFWTSDGAPWNRSLWKLLGIKASSKEITCKVPHPVDTARSLHFISDFPHLIKCVRNTIVSKGVQIPCGHAHVDVIKEAWKRDKEALTLKVMPHITQAHVQPNAFEKMRVNLAFQLFSQEVLKGHFFYKGDLERRFRTTEPTEQFVKLMEMLIFVMSSRVPSKGLRAQSGSAQFLKKFIAFLSEWEEYAAQHGGGFLSAGTALGLRVTLQSTLSLLDYLITSVHYKYLLTANLSQDELENIFGIVRQSFGCNDHPAPEQFLVIINNLTFYSLARPPKNGNSPAEVVTALLQPSDAGKEKAARVTAVVDELLDEGSLAHAAVVLKEHSSLIDHHVCVEKRSDSRLIYYVAGYVVRKSLKKFPCPECASCLSVLPLQAECNGNASLTREFDHGGLLYPSKPLEALVTRLENAFTVFFTRNKLHAKSMICFLRFLQGHALQEVGCSEHGRLVTANVIKFYALTRMHFFAKAVNKDRDSQREKQKLLKMRPCR
ncbi:uncharacterized protein LOC120845949 [Ixodes scapularis]|uniref:uncharacterized protein LOC120845949 n=1 Tax=Ixodes scapularis TaxID=6945 RepID=UPI001A9E5A70|nr:uncharacterized protein LOC120845949 [Ixodes scapularis]